MSERLLQKLGGTSETETTSLLTPDLAETVESMGGTTVPRGQKAAQAGGWEPGMEVTTGVTLVELVADGGMGSVWVADHARLGTRVAVKLVSLAVLEKQPSLVERLDLEAAALSRLANPHIVSIYEHGTTANGTPYIVMELLDGVTLWRLVKRHGPLSLTEVAAIVEQVADALAAAHGRGIIHRDVKPQNIFLFGRDGRLAAKLIDFGIAKELEVNAISSVTRTGTLLGTPHFMSPEQLLTPKKVDARTDLWALGVVVYHALTRKLPFDGETLAGLFANITTGTFPKPSERAPHLPPEVDAWVAKALAMEPQERFRTARELGQSLKRLVLELPPGVADERGARARLRDAARDGDALGDTERPPPPTPAAGPDDDEESLLGPPLSRPGARPAAPSPPAESQPSERLLPYPFALLQDAPVPEAAAPLHREDRGAARLRKLLVLGVVVTVLALLVVVLTR